MNQGQLRRVLRSNPYLFTLLLVVVGLVVIGLLQDNLFTPRVINGYSRTMLPLMILAVGQTIVVIAGGIDLSVGAMVSLVGAVLVTQLAPDSGGSQFTLVLTAGMLAGAAAGAFNGLVVSILRLQPIVTTYATSFIYAGLALWILPRPGGAMPKAIATFYRQEMPLGLPWFFFVALGLILLWVFARSTRYGRYLFAVGGQPEAAYATGVPVNWVKFSTYVVAGLLAAGSALALTLGTSSGDPRGGETMTLDSIVAVVLGGTRLSGGQGGVAGSILGVILLTIIRSIISFANVPSWYQTLVNALIIVGALAAPGFIRLVRHATRGRRL